VELTGISGKVAVVTGAGQGLGEAIAIALGAAGAAVACADRNPETGARTAATITAAGGRAFGAAIDVARRADAQALVAQTVDRLGRIDILVNVAGILRVAPVLELTDEQWDDTFAVNTKGVFLCSQEAARIMVGQGGGNIVNIASNAAVVPRIDQAAYCASKAAVAHLTRCFGLELSAHCIRVNAVCPGIARTPMQVELMQGSLGLEAALVGGAQEKFRIGVPLRKMAEPRDVANAVCWLVSDQAGHVTMQSIVVDGGGSLGVSS
jgi:2,3-dihydro-2,3-dihydroxybenzoate dehydrogenase